MEELMHHSPWNLACRPQNMRVIELCDCTVREGEQTPGAAFDNTIRRDLANRIANLGVSQIEVGYPGASKEDREMTEMLTSLQLPTKIEGIAMINVHDWKKQIRDTVDSKVDIVSMQLGISDLHLEHVLHMSRKEVLSMMERAVKTAQDLGAKTTSFSPTDTTRADPHFTLTVYEKLQEWGVSRVRVIDSMGAVSPAGLRGLVTSIRKIIDIPIGVHCHNDYGLALANAVAAVESGADFVDVVANGLGERTGIVSLDEMALVLAHLYGQKPPVHMNQLYQFSHEVERLMNVPLSRFKPITGLDAFAHQIDVHIQGLAQNPQVFEPFDPSLVGNQRRLPLGRLSGKHAITHYLHEWAIDPEKVDIQSLVKSLRSKAVESRGEVEPEWLRQQVAANMSS
jgi:isopropylmalate/homocitrate/citramalate synthase